jgi:hypothetical protein
MLHVAGLRHTYANGSHTAEAIGHLDFEVGEHEFLWLPGRHAGAVAGLPRRPRWHAVPTGRGGRGVVVSHAERHRCAPAARLVVDALYQRGQID